MTHYFLGIDIGATKSHALFADENGQALGFGQDGPGNYEVVGWDGLRRVLHTITDQALGAANLTRSQIAGAGLGVAGYDWPAEREPTRQAIASLGLSAPYEFVNDATIGLLAGATRGWGVVVAAGTSNNCRGRDPQGRRGGMTGCGPMFGEYGGGSELVAKAVQAVALAWTQRGPATRLTEAFMALTGASDAMALLQGLALARYYLGAAHAPTVFQVAAEGDEVARETVRWAGRELGDLALGVIRQLGLQDTDLEVVLAGSLYEGGPLLIDPMRETIQAVAPRARLVRLTAPPVVGGVLLGMEQAGLAYTGIRQTLIETTKALLTKDRSARRKTRGDWANVELEPN
jgi:N-acetylglucosamine kinase-like BadF-type ATPase